MRDTPSVMTPGVFERMATHTILNVDVPLQLGDTFDFGGIIRMCEVESFDLIVPTGKEKGDGV
jgi:hypothetical protein